MVQQFQVKPIRELTPQILELIYRMRDEFILTNFGKILYDYQREPSNAIIKAALLNEGKTIPIEISRQAGKTDAEVYTQAFILVHINRLLEWLGRPILGGFNIVLGAPQTEQAKTAFDRLKAALDQLQSSYDISHEESNGTTLKLAPYGNTVYCLPVNATAKIESKTAHLIIMEEMQDVPDNEYEKKVMPMGTATNANTVMIGTAGYHLCRFYKALESGGEVYKYDCYEVMRQKRLMYEKTGNPFHLNYEKYIRSKLLELGDDNPQIRTQYFLEWQLEKGMFITEKDFKGFVADGMEGRPHWHTVREAKDRDCYVTIDVAKESDVTFITVYGIEGNKDVVRRIPTTNSEGAPVFAEETKKLPIWRVLNRYMINGTLYQDQWEAIDKFLENYRVASMEIDSTGVGDATADYYLRKYNRWDWDTLKRYEKLKIRGIVLPVKFTPQSKHTMASNFDVVRKEGRFIIPCPCDMNEQELSCHKRFKNEALNAIREWKGNLLNVRHVDKSKGESGDVETDDSVDSALLRFFDPDKKPHKITMSFA